MNYYTLPQIFTNHLIKIILIISTFIVLILPIIECTIVNKNWNSAHQGGGGIGGNNLITGTEEKVCLKLFFYYFFAAALLAFLK